MHILLSNDDGYAAAGLAALADGLSDLGKLTVFAPAHDCSGSSHSLTLDRPLRVTKADNGFNRVTGTPTDCVHLAINGFLEDEPDFVVSGINHGANMGDDVLYSGTVAAAIEGRFLGLPAVAVSLSSLLYPRYFATAAHVAKRVVQHIQHQSLPNDLILNVNVPDVPLNELKGIRITRLGSRHRSEGVVKMTDPRGRPGYWIGAAGDAADAGEGTDFHAVAAGYASITPLQIDLTKHAVLPQLSDWASGI